MPPWVARYSKILPDHRRKLAWLGELVVELGRVVHAICSERIAQLEAKVWQWLALHHDFPAGCRGDWERPVTPMPAIRGYA